MKGTIRVEYWVGCGKCADTVVLVDAPIPRNKSMAGEQAKRLGWVYTRADGYICPRCAEERRNTAD